MDLGQIIAEFITTKGLDKVYSYAEKYLTSRNKMPIYDMSYFIESLKQNLTKTVNWSTNITYGISTEDINTSEIYVDLDYFDFNPRESLKSNHTISQNLLSDDFLHTNKHLIILGEGGSGKSTSMQILSHKMLTEPNYLTGFNFPLILRLREHNENLKEISNHLTRDLEGNLFNTYKNNILFWALYKEVGIAYRTSNTISENMQYHLDIQNGFIRKYVIEVLNLLKPIIILDGFDELNIELKSKIVDEISELCLALTDAKLIITSRTGEFEHYTPNTKKVKIAPFDDKKTFSFCLAWMKSTEKGQELFEAIKKTPFYDTTIRPINLTHLAILYKENGALPLKPKAVYNQLINLHISKWDNLRSIKRQNAFEKYSDLSQFDSSVKYDFLSHLAYHLSIENSIVFDFDKLKSIYEKSLMNKFKLDYNHFKNVINEIELQTGLFIQKSPELFEFPHKSIQEFLTAEYISKFQPLDDINLEISKLPNELAIATSLSTNPNYFFLKAFELYLETKDIKESNLLIYFRRLVVEKPIFNASEVFGYKILSLWQKLLESSSLHQKFVQLLELTGFKESIKKLENLYYINSSFIAELNKLKRNLTEERLLNISATLQRRPQNWDPTFFIKEFNVPLLFVSDWESLKKYF